MNAVDESVSRPPEGTALLLIEAATRLFAQKGYSATSTREVAAAAGANLASIAYHFGGKEGLRRACGIEFTRKLGETLASVEQPDELTPEIATATLHGIIRAIVPAVVGSEQAQAMVSFILRELFEHGPTADLIYERFIDPAHRRFCDLWAIASHSDPEDPELKLRVFSMIGQVLYFRVASPFVIRRMGWRHLRASEIKAITDLLLANLATLLAAEQEP